MNVSSGNLVLQVRDEVVVGRGADVESVRTYNSHGVFDDDNGDNWAVAAFGQRVQLGGAIGEPGSTLTRTDRDGARAVHAWEAGQKRYVSPEGAGAFDTIAFDAGAGQYIWTDGDSGLIERYEASGAGRLVSVTDVGGNTVAYAYNANGTVRSATGANGEVTFYDYRGTQLEQIRTATAGGAALTRVRYAYDGENRLSRVTVDLSPEDNSIADGKTYVTAYSYDGASKRVAGVSQGDGTALRFTYVQAGGVYKVATVSDALGGVTSFAYEAGATRVTDALGAQSVYLYDARGQLTQVRRGVTAANTAGLSRVGYGYDVQGNVTLVTDGEGRQVRFEYDERGNLLKEVDAAGNTRSRTYGAHNQLLTDSLYADAAVTERGVFNREAGLAETVRYVYAVGNSAGNSAPGDARQLRFAIDARGGVTEYRYDAYGQRTSAIRYVGAAYGIAALAAQGVPSEAQMVAWRGAGAGAVRSQRTDYTYDGRGALGSSTTYGAVLANGEGDAATAATTRYVYDTRGLLLQKIEPGSRGATSYVYDGLGRVLSVSAPSLDGAKPSLTLTSYDDAAGKTTLTLANGLASVSAYDRAGRRVSVTESGVGAGVLGTTAYAYDRNGNLLMTQDPTGARQWMVYDAARRKVGDIDATGALTEYVYDGNGNGNGNGQLRQTIAYAGRVDTARLVDAAGAPRTAWSESGATLGLAALRPAASAQDQKSWRFYDLAGRLAWQVDALGYVTQTTYDGASRILAVTRLANPIDVAQLNKLGHGASVELLVDAASVGGIALRVDAAPVAPGSPVALTAEIEGTDPGGMVSFFSGERLVGSAAVVKGRAVLVTSALPVGVNNLRAAYSGDAQRVAGISPVVQKTMSGTLAEVPKAIGVTVARVPSQLTNLSAASIARDGTLSVRVQGAAPGGLVSFYSGAFNGGARLLGTARVADGVAVLSGVALPPGTHSFTAAYAGDARNADSALSFAQEVTGTPVASVLVRLDNAEDRTVTRLYNRAGQLQGSVDAEGYLTEHKYNAGGELTETLRYAGRAANFASAAQWLAAVGVARDGGDLAGLRPGLSGDDQHDYKFYDARGRLVGEVDAEGYLGETVYDVRGNVTQSIRYADRAGAVGSASTLASLRQVANRNPAQSRQIEQTWSEANRLLGRTSSEGGAEGSVTRFAYDSVGRLVQSTTAAGTPDERVQKLRYDLQGRLVGELDGRGSEAVGASGLASDALGLWAANGLTHSYDAAGRRTASTDANGRRTLFFYDPIGRLRYSVNALGEVTESRYSALGQLSEHIVYGSRVDMAALGATLGTTSPGGLNSAALAAQLAKLADATKDSRVVRTYNATGTQASSTDALGYTTRYAYNAFREATASRRDAVKGGVANGVVVTDTAAFDRRGLRTHTVQDAAALKLGERSSYDAFGRVTDRFDANGRRSRLAYDRLGRLVQSTDALDAERLTQYDAFERVLRQRDAVGQWTSYGYDSARRSSSVTTPEGVVVTTVRNRQGQTQSVSDGRGNTTRYSYDKSGNLVQTDTPLGTTTRSTFDKTGLVLQTTDARGVRTDHSYDAANRLLTRTVDAGAGGLRLATTYGYDAKGQTLSVTDPRGIVSATEFDLGGRAVCRTVDPSGLRLQTRYAHDAAGRVLSVTDPNGNLTRYTYDGAGRRVKEQRDPEGLNLTRSYDYDAAGNLVRATDASGNATRYAYDEGNRRVFALDALGGVSQSVYDNEGRLRRSTAYAVPIDTAGLGNAPSAAAIQAALRARPGAGANAVAVAVAVAVAGAASDMIESRTYNGDGQLRFAVDGTGAVTEYSYDKAGNVAEQRRYAQRIDLAAWDLLYHPVVAADAARDERVRTAYDAANRAIWRVDGAGNAVQFSHDASGNVTETRAYATPLGAGAFNGWNGQSAPAVAADGARDQRTRSVYDAAGRAIWQVDGAGGVVSTAYDARGNVREQRAYAGAMSAAALAAWDGRSAPAVVADNRGRDQRERNVHDAANRLTWRADGDGAVARTDYDRNGNVTRRTRFANAIGERDAPESVIASDSVDRITDYLYDTADRLRYQLRWTDSSDWMSDPGGLRLITSYNYDGAGRLIRQTEHDRPLPSAVPNDIDSIFANLSGGRIRKDGLDHPQYMAYDAAGRLRYRVDGAGAVTRHSYDGAGRVVATTQFARAISTRYFTDNWLDRAVLQLGAQAIEAELRPDADADRTTAMAYDGAGRRSFSVDALGGVGRSVYDAFGNLTRHIGYARRIEAPGVAAAPGGVPVAAGRYGDAALRATMAAQADAGADRVQRYAWDQANRQIFALDAVGGVTESSYDGVGNNIRTVRYAQPLDATGSLEPARDAPSVAELRARLKPDAANDRLQQRVFDAAGREVYGVDALGYVTRTEYDALGQAVRSTQYMNALSRPLSGATGATGTMAGANAAAGVTAEQIASALTIDEEADRTSTQVFDAAGRVFQRTNVHQENESWRYDALGNKVSYTNARRAQWTYAYDRVGNLVEETSPEVRLATAVPGADGRLQLGPSGPGRVVTRLLYDAFGNLRSRTEAAGRPEERTTRYAYDALNRQIWVMHPGVDVYDPASEDITTNGANGPAARVDRRRFLTTETVYDALGNAVANQDLGDNRSYKTYDRLGRIAHEVDALGFVTGYERNTFGEATALTRYGAATALAAGRSTQLSAAQVQGGIDVRDDTSRTILTRYDRLGRIGEVTEPISYVYDSSLGAAGNASSASSASSPYAWAGKVTRNTWNTFGDLRQVAVSQGVNDTWALTRNVHDRRGQQIASVDALGYLSTQAFDAAGNVVARSEYATALGNVQASALANAQANAQSAEPMVALLAKRIEDPANDRHTRTAYDASNRKSLETRLNVEYSEASDGGRTRGDLSTSYVYDAVGNLTRTNDALGGITRTDYDALGRVSAVTGPKRSSTEGGEAVTPLTIYSRDAHGNAVAKTDYARGAAEPEYAGGGALIASVAPLAADPMAAQMPRPNPEIAALQAQGYASQNDTGYFSSTPFPGSLPLYRIQGTVFSTLNAYTTGEEERALSIASLAWKDAGRVGYVAGTQTEGTVPLHRLRQFAAPWSYTQLVADAAQRKELMAQGWTDDGVLGYVATRPTATLDVALHHMRSVLLDPIAGAVGAQNHLYVAGSVKGDPLADPLTYAELLARTDRTSLMRYDSFGREVQRTDAMGVSHYSAYNAQGLIAKAWQSVGDDAASRSGTRTLWRAYGYDALGRQTHIYEPGANTGETLGTSGANPDIPTGRIDTALQYNAFGELTAKAVNGQTVEYFDYNRAGRLWRTNAGDGVDKIALYDLQGRQSAEIRSAGRARGDLDLRSGAIRGAHDVARRTDVRRTDSVYDALGRVRKQLMAERLETRNGSVSVQSGSLHTAIVASGGTGKDPFGTLLNPNIVELGWPGFLADLGNGDVRVTLAYIPSSFVDLRPQTHTQVFAAAQAAHGVRLGWDDSVGSGYSGVHMVSAVRVEKQDQFGVWRTLIERDGASGAGYAGRSVAIAATAAGVGPAPATQVRMQVRTAAEGATSAGPWMDAPLINFGASLRYDASKLALGRYDYRVLTTTPDLPGVPETETANGSLHIAPRVLDTIQLQTTQALGADTFAWQGPGGSDRQTLRLRPTGGNGAWTEQFISHPTGDARSAISLAGLDSGSYDYELLWRRAAEEGPYAHATGQIRKTAGVADVVVAPVGLPPIRGLWAAQTQAGEGRTIGTVIAPMKFGHLGGFAVKSPGDAPRMMLPLFADRSGLFVRIYVTQHLKPGVYEYVYVHSLPPSLEPTDQATGRLIVFSDDTIALEDTTPAYTPGYTVAGTPSTYAFTATAPGPYAQSQDPLLGGPQLGIGLGRNGGNAQLRPVVEQNVDRWGNVVSITDPRAIRWKTTYRYNANNQLIEQVQPDADGKPGAGANGAIVNADAPVTRLYYDALGRQVAVRDANGRVNGQVWDAGGNLVEERRADGGTVRHAYDAFGNRVRTLDAMDLRTTYIHDKLNRLLKTRREGGVEETSTWDAAGRKLTQTNGAGETIRYTYDLRGNLTRTTQPMGQSTQAGYDAFNRKVVEVDANGNRATWRHDPFGQLKESTDIGQARYSYTYDNARQLITQSSTRGQSLRYEYDAAGQRTRIRDDALNKDTTYSYDLSGRRTQETTVQDGVTYQDNRIAYDALGRMRWVADTRAFIDIDYDKMGNRTRIRTRLRDESGEQAVVRDTQRHYQYDAMNRQTVVDAENANGNLGADGHRLTYDRNGRRTSDTRNGPGIVAQGQPNSGQWAIQRDGSTTESYDYDRLNRLTGTTRDGALVEARVYDGASRVVMSGPSPTLGPNYIELHRQLRPETRNDGLQARQSWYDANGRLTNQKTHEFNVTSSEAVYRHDAAGNVTGYEVFQIQGSSLTQTTNTVVPAQGYQTTASESRTTAVGGKNAGAPLANGKLIYTYDANGHLQRTTDMGQLKNMTLRAHNFVNDVNGNALYASYSNENTPQNRMNPQRQLIVNGEVLGRYGQAADTRYEGTQWAQIAAQNGPIFTAQSDISFGYRPIGGKYPAGTPGTYAVGASDTLQTIAKGAYGDAGLWYLIADANGLSSNADLRIGQILRIPAQVDNANNEGTFKPYDPSQIANDTATMLAVPQGRGGGCGGIGQIIVAVVAVVVAAITQQYYLAQYGGMAASGAVGGAVGSIAGQTVGMAIGAQDSFSWKNVALAAVGGAVGAGLAGSTPLGGAVNDIGNVMARSAIGNAATQGIAVATGLQPSFSWKSVAASAVSAGAAQGLNAAMDYDPRLTGNFELGKSLASGVGGSIVGQAVRGGRVSATTLATDAFGNVLGDSIAAANGQKAIPAPVSADERARIMGRFADGPGSNSTALRPDIPSATADRLLMDLGVSGKSIYGPGVQYANARTTRTEVMTDAGGASEADGDDWPYVTQSRGSDGSFTITAHRTPPNTAETAAPQTLGEVLNTGSRTPYNPNWQADSIRNTLNALTAQQTARNTPSMRAWDARTDGVHIAQQRALANYLNGQGSMALGGVAASISMVSSRDVQAASMVTDLAAPIDSLIAPMGGGGRTAMASTARRMGGPGLVPNQALEIERVLKGDASRAKIVEQIGKAAQPSIDALLRLDTSAQIGFRGSLASGLKGEHKIDVNGNRVAFDGDVAFKLDQSRRYQPYNSKQGYDADFFVVSDKLAAQLGNRRDFMDAAELNGGALAPVFDAFGRSLQSNPVLSGMKPGDTTFRVWSRDAINRKLQGGDAQIYFFPGGQR